MGLGRFELPTSRLSGVRSNQLSYRPARYSCRSAGESAEPPCRSTDYQRTSEDDSLKTEQERHSGRTFVRAGRSHAIPFDLGAFNAGAGAPFATSFGSEAVMLLRKEVIQPQVLLQLPCYDFTPITDHTLGGCPPCGLAHRLLVQPTFVM